jgi:hypothetical protein
MSRPWQGVVARGYTADEFKAYVEAIQFKDWKPEFVVLHNTAVPRFDQWHDVPGARRMAGLVGYYRDDQKWSAGPHLFIADDLIWVFTPLTTHGIHAPSWNEISWGVEMVGDYDHEELSIEVFNNTISALTTLHKKIDKPAQSLRFHKEDPATTHRSCPGHNVDKTEFVQILDVGLASL